MPENEQDESSLLEEANRREREITLAARDNPEEAVLADGTPLLEYREKVAQEHAKEGSRATKLQVQRIKEQSVGSDPIYQGKLEPQEGSPGTFTIIPDSEEDQRERFQAERMKRSVVVDSKGQEKPTPPSPSPTLSSGQPLIATQPPDKLHSNPDSQR